MLKEKFNNQKYEVYFTDEDYEYYNTVRQSFLSDLLEKIEVLDKQLFDLSETEEISAKKDLLYNCNRAAHSIKGTGYSFGFKFISEVSFCIEEILDYVLNNKLDLDIFQKILNVSLSFNDLLSDVIRNYFLQNDKFDVPSEYNNLLLDLIDKTDNVLNKKNNDNKSHKNILICGINKFIFNNIQRCSEKNEKCSYNFNCFYASDLPNIFTILQNNKIDYIFSEYDFKNFTALAVYSALPHIDGCSNIPFYFIVSNVNSELLSLKIDNKFILLKNKSLLSKLVNIVTKKI